MCLVLTLVSFANSPCVVFAAEPTWKVGAAKVDITPEHPVRLSGYGDRREETARVAQRIHAKALALTPGVNETSSEQLAIWMTFENCGITPDIRNHVANRLAQQIGLSPERLSISVTHSHTAPALTNWAPLILGENIPAEHQQHIDAYTQKLIDSLTSVAKQAVANQVPASLEWGNGSVTFARNRRLMANGKWENFGEQPNAPVDHSLPLLVARRESGEPLALVMTYACHCTTLGGAFNQIAGDWAGSAMLALERIYPNSIAMVNIGCGADANPHPRGDDLSICDQQGGEIVTEVQRLLQGRLTPLSPQLICRLETIQLPFQPAKGRHEWEARAQEEGAMGSHARSFLRLLDSGQEIPTKLPYPVAVWTFANDLAMVFLGGEVVVDYATRLRSMFDPQRLWLVAYTNDVPCYIPSARILREGGYEAESSMYYYARPERLAPECEDYLVDTVQRLVPHSFYGEQLGLDFPGPRLPQDTCDSIRLPLGLRAEVVAAEPLIEDPVAIDWGPDGSLFVVEMRDYPNGLTWHQQGDPLEVPGGRVKLLRDTNQDGVFDKSTVFVDGLSFPCGIKFWRKGVLVSAAPSIWYLEDQNSDDIADLKQPFFSGFSGGNPQHRANGITWGLDNWLYVANGEATGSIRADISGKSVEINGRDLSIRPDEGDLQTESGRTQYGRCRNDFNDWFGGNNSDPLWHYVLDDRYLRRNPHVEAPSVRRDVPEVPGAGPVFPASRTLARFNDFYAADRFTSACSPEIYRDQRLLPWLGAGETHVFVCEPVHNLVHREIIEAQGVTFRSHRAKSEQSSEFLASTDNWCRPVAARVGPDGALWVVDMYRQVLEHPEWIPWLWQRKLDLRCGTNLGRIYRISEASPPANQKTGASPLPRLDLLSASELVERLAHPNGWQRDMAQQMLLWKKDLSVVPQLQALVIESDSLLAKLHALYTLAGLESLDDKTLLLALQEGHPALRRHAVRLAEASLDRNANILARVRRLVHDNDPTVAMQVAYSLGATQNPSVGKDLAELLRRYASDEYMAAAVMSSLRQSNLREFAQEWLSTKNPPAQTTAQVLRIAVGLQDAASLSQLATMQIQQASPSGQPGWDAASGVFEALQSESMFHLLAEPVQERLNAIVESARDAIRSGSSANVEDSATNQGGPELVPAVRLLGVAHSSQEDDCELLYQLLRPATPPEVQEAVVHSLMQRFPQKFAAVVLKDWSAHGPVLRRAIMEAFQQLDQAVPDLLQAVEQGLVAREQLDARARQWLVTLGDSALRERAILLFGVTNAADKDQLISTYLKEAHQTGHPESGKEVFARRCATCHRLGGMGYTVGPDLAVLTDRSPHALLTAILDPNRAVEAKYLEYIASIEDGRQLAGIITEETSTSVTLVGPDGKKDVLARTAFESLSSSGRSLMPEGLEKDITPEDCKHLLAFIGAAAIPPKSFPGNDPELAHVRDDGSIRLLALNAKVFGPTLVFEEKYRNLGFWQSPDDYAVWMMNVPKAGPYAVYLDYACDDFSAGNRFTISVQDQTVGGTVRGTGSWDNYSECSSGTLNLPQGYVELVMRSDGSITNSLIDLRQIVLAPVE